MAACLFLAAAVPHASWLVAADVPPVAYPLWDGHETIAHYASRVNLPETQTLDLGNGVSLELVLIPAGKFIMGTPEPQPVDEAAFYKKIVTGKAVLATGGGILLVLIGFAVLRAIRERHRFQYSLARFMAMMLAASLCVLGGMHWWHSKRGLEEARAEYSAAMARFKDAFGAEMPAHEVTITKPFYMGKYDVTEEQYQQVMGVNPSYFYGLNLPVEMVSWNDAKDFCKKANSVQQSSGLLQPQSGGLRHTIRLPTKAEWEYACRAGTVTTYYSGDKESDLARVAWYLANSGYSLHPVGQKEPNAWGLYDMHGNLFQWCEDWHGEYSNGAGTGTVGVYRGGCWRSIPRGCRSAFCPKGMPGDRFNNLGFRVVVARTP